MGDAPRCKGTSERAERRCWYTCYEAGSSRARDWANGHVAQHQTNRIDQAPQHADVAVALRSGVVPDKLSPIVPSRPPSHMTNIGSTRHRRRSLHCHACQSFTCDHPNQKRVNELCWS